MRILVPMYLKENLCMCMSMLDKNLMGFCILIQTPKNPAWDSDLGSMNSWIEIRCVVTSMWINMIIKKRFGVRNFVQFLALKDTYSIGPKVKKKKQEV